MLLGAKLGCGSVLDIGRGIVLSGGVCRRKGFSLSPEIRIRLLLRSSRCMNCNLILISPYTTCFFTESFSIEALGDLLVPILMASDGS